MYDKGDAKQRSMSVFVVEPSGSVIAKKLLY